jgi:ComF family protein
MEQLKYKGRKELGPMLAAFASMPLQRTGFFNDIDVLVPVPLHPDKERKRGYNQSLFIAKGISKTTDLPVCTAALIRLADNKTQTRKSLYDRWQNVDTLFKLADTKSLEHKHVLLVDDVLTSGSTLEACGKAVLEANGARVSFFALCRA